MTPSAPPLSNLLRRVRVDRATGCWLWSGATAVNGYGKVSRGSRKSGWKSWSTHRLVFTWLRGPIPEGLVLDHLCRTRLCCNPAHLEAVTDKVNILRPTSLAPSALNSRRQACKNGHPYDHIYVEPHTGYAHRRCSICMRDADRRYKARRRDLAESSAFPSST